MKLHTVTNPNTTIHIDHRTCIYGGLGTIRCTVFSHLFSNTILEYIVEQSNLYAQQTMGAAKYNTWQIVTLEELKAYLGFNLLMGLVWLPEIEDYWKQDCFFHYAPIADQISRDRFREISRYLHFCDNSTWQIEENEVTIN